MGLPKVFRTRGRRAADGLWDACTAPLAPATTPFQKRLKFVLFSGAATNNPDVGIITATIALETVWNVHGVIEPRSCCFKIAQQLTNGQYTALDNPTPAQVACGLWNAYLSQNKNLGGQSDLPAYSGFENLMPWFQVLVSRLFKRPPRLIRPKLSHTIERVMTEQRLVYRPEHDISRPVLYIDQDKAIVLPALPLPPLYAFDEHGAEIYIPTGTILRKSHGSLYIEQTGSTVSITRTGHIGKYLRPLRVNDHTWAVLIGLQNLVDNAINVRDWLSALNVNNQQVDLFRLSWISVRNAAKRWHAQAVIVDTRIELPKFGLIGGLGTPYADIGNGWTLFKLNTHEDFRAESDVGNHCIGTASIYFTRHQAGTHTYYSLRDPNEHQRVTFEIYNDGALQGKGWLDRPVGITEATMGVLNGAQSATVRLKLPATVTRIASNVPRVYQFIDWTEIEMVSRTLTKLGATPRNTRDFTLLPLHDALVAMGLNHTALKPQEVLHKSPQIPRKARK